MAYRTTINGVEVSCDTPQELVQLVNATSRAIATPATSPAAAGLHSIRRPQPVVRTLKPPRAGSSTRFSRPNKLGMQALTVLKQHYPNELTSERLASEIGKSPNSLPIIMSSLTAWARYLRTTIGALVKRQVKYIDGRQQSVYSITQDGIKAFEKMQDERLPM